MPKKQVRVLFYKLTHIETPSTPMCTVSKKLMYRNL